MKIQEVRNLGQRPASNLSVIVKFLFGNNMPSEFQPGHIYQKGDTVYTISEDGLTIKLWTCNIAGSYPNTSEPNWTEFSISKVLDQKLVKIVRALYSPHPKLYSQTQSIGTYTVSNLRDSVKYMGNTPSYMDVFYEGKLVSPNSYEIIDGELKSLNKLKNESKVMVDNYTPAHDLSRLVRRVTYVNPVAETVNFTFNLPTDKWEKWIDCAELYVSGKFIPHSDWTAQETSDGKVMIAPKDGADFASHGVTDAVVLNIMASMSNTMTVNHTEYSVNIQNDMDSYDVDITDSGYINVYQTISVFVDGIRMDDSKFHFSKGFLNIRDVNDYLKKGSTLQVSVYSFIPNEYVFNDVNDENRRYITESVEIVENNTRLIPIPFLRFDEDLDDFIVFNENGALISSAKYYIDNNYIRYYSHDQGVYIGDTLNFKMIDRNRNTLMRTFILTATEKNQKMFDLPFDSNDYEFSILFYSVGVYISPNEYTMAGNSLIITHDMSLEVGDRLEVIVFAYPSGVGSTLMDYHRIFVDEEVRNTFDLDFQFDPAVTSFMIFTNTGLYIGEKFYEISNDNILTIKGERVYKGGWIDIISVQSTEALTSADNILGLL